MTATRSQAGRQHQMPKAHLVYYLLAALDIVVIIAGLLLSHQIMQSFENALGSSAAFERQLAAVRNLSDAATDAHAAVIDGLYLGNAAQSQQDYMARSAEARFEMGRIRQFVSEFFTASARNRMNNVLTRIDRALGSMDQHAARAFDYRAAGNQAATIAEVKQLQARYITLRRDVRDVNQLTALVRSGNLERGRSEAAGLQNYKLVIGGLIVLIVACVVFYGHYISKLMRRKYEELQTAHDAATRAEAEANAASTQLLSVNEDIIKLNQELQSNLTRLRDAQDENLRKGKMAHLGQLTATVAHELRNPLGAVRTSAFLLERKIRGKGLGVEPQLERINNGVTRCDDIISQLLDFARTKDLQREELVFDTWLMKLVEEEAQKLPEMVSVECHLGLGETMVVFDQARMSRVLINLISNASEAMVGRGDDAARVLVTSPKIVVESSMSARGIEISVVDNGPGISAEVIGKIMEPLFTTKNFGTGLGLPAVEKILQQHGGGLEVASKPGEGARFTAWWPNYTSLKEAV